MTICISIARQLLATTTDRAGALRKRCNFTLSRHPTDHYDDANSQASTCIMQTHGPKEGSVMATESVATETRPEDVGLRREMGLIGATWASETSIIGSGWLFGALGAAAAAGALALFGWLIAGVIVIILALVHAELGGMYPVSGGTARFPHFAFGSGAGITFGFFSYLQAVTVAPIECFAVMQYGSYYWHSIYDPVKGNVT